MKRRLLPAFLCLLLIGGPTSASCAGPDGLSDPDRIERSKVAFDGTVLRFRNGDNRWAIVKIDKLLKGPRQPDAVEVWGTGLGRQPQLGMGSSIDRSFLLGGRYRFFFNAQDSEPFKDGACTATKHLGGGVFVRPDRHAVVPEPAPLSPQPFPWTPVGAGVGSIVGGLLVLAITSRRMNRKPTSS